MDANCMQVFETKSEIVKKSRISNILHVKCRAFITA
jgi:hypothetical protein